MRRDGARIAEVLAVALRLGLTSFGGPIAHIGYFRREYVERRRWVDEATFADLVALCQALPGPASSQLGIAIGTLRAGFGGGLAAWLGFTLPSALVMVAFGLVTSGGNIGEAPWVHGLKLAAVAIVAQAVLQMRRGLAPDIRRRAIAVAALVVSLALPSPVTPLVVIVGGAIAGIALVSPGIATAAVAPLFRVAMSRRAGALALAIFAGLLVALPVLRDVSEPQAFAVADVFARAGALVFGGGHVVLPLLHDAVVANGWVDESSFLAGYGAAQAVPGPLFSFAGYLGAAMIPEPHGIAGAVIALVAIFLPGALLVWGVLPFWSQLQGWRSLQRARMGIGAAVVGLLAAALYDPVWLSAVRTPADVGVALAAFLALVALRLPPVLIVVASAAAAQLLL